MGFVLASIEQSLHIRWFAFQSVSSNGTRTECRVGVDTSLVRTYAISLQELPLLCREFLAARAGNELAPELIFSEAEMVAHANRRAAAKEAEERQKAQRKVHVNRSG
jgi:hypothetical protein